MRFRSITTILLVATPLLAQEPLQIQETDGKFQTIIVHREDVQPRATLVMKALRGDAIVIGTDVHRIVIEERIQVKTRYRATAEEIINRVRGALVLSDPSEDIYAFKVGDWPTRDVLFDYKVRVPRTFNVILNTYGGDLDLSELLGDLEAKTGGGDVAVSTAAGRVQVFTGGGDISLFKIQGQMEVQTGGGEISGRHLEGKVTAQTGGGRLEFYSCTGDFTLQTGGGDIDLEQLAGTGLSARTGGGNIDITSASCDLNLMTGGGSIQGDEVTGTVEAATKGGNLRFQQIRGDAILFTASGNIELESVSGAVRLKTQAGDIDIDELLFSDPGRDTSTISSLSGDITVHMLTGQQIDIEALVRQMPLRYGTAYIKSNLDLDYTSNDEGTYGRYRVDQPDHVLIIETTNGEIHITKEED